MALVVADRVRETTTTTGTGTLSLAGAETGFQSFSSGVGDSNTTYYAVSSIGGSEWEVGIGTYTASGSTLSRDTILDSSNSGSAVNLSAGEKDVYVVYPAGKAVYEDASNNVTLAGDLTVSGGDITLSGTGRIQGVDTVSAGTDAVNKTYVDNAVSAIGSTFPFYKADGSLDTIGVTNGAFPFYKEDGSQDNIGVS